MKLFSLACSTLVLALAPVYGAVDPTLLGLVMPDATAVAGIQVAQSQASPFGRYLLSEIGPKTGKDRDRLFTETGFDPLRDLQEIVAASATGNKGVLLGRGFFQPARISAAATLHGAAVTNYKGFDIISGKDGGQGSGRNGDGALAFLDASTVAISDLATVKAVIDRRVSGAVFSGDLARRARDVSSSNDAWVVTNAPANLLPHGGPTGPQDVVPPQTRVLQSIKQFSGGVRFGSSTVSVTGEALTASNQDAQALADVLRFVAGMAQGDEHAARLLAGAKFAAEGATTKMTIDVPEDQIEGLFADRRQPSRAPQRRR